MSFVVTWMDLEVITLSEIRQRKIKDDTTYMQNLKTKTQINLFTKQKQTHRQRNKLMVMKLERCRVR